MPAHRLVTAQAEHEISSEEGSGRNGGKPFRVLTVQWDLNLDIAPGCNLIDGADHRYDMRPDARPVKTTMAIRRDPRFC